MDLGQARSHEDNVVGIEEVAHLGTVNATCMQTLWIQDSLQASGGKKAVMCIAPVACEKLGRSDLDLGLVRCICTEASTMEQLFMPVLIAGVTASAVP
eukprot:scaffold138049_cov14-Tisochrysis_lutea.AAC.1